MNYRDSAIRELVELRTVVIGDMFPGLRQHAARPINQDLQDQRSITTLKRLGCVSWGDIRSLTVGDLWLVPSAGRLTVERILTTAREMASLGPVAGNWSPPRVPGSGASASEPTASSFQRERVSALTEMLADWATDIHAATNLGDLLD